MNLDAKMGKPLFDEDGKFANQVYEERVKYEGMKDRQKEIDLGTLAGHIASVRDFSLIASLGGDTPSGFQGQAYETPKDGNGRSTLVFALRGTSDENNKDYLQDSVWLTNPSFGTTVGGKMEVSSIMTGSGFSPVIVHRGSERVPDTEPFGRDQFADAESFVRRTLISRCELNPASCQDVSTENLVRYARDKEGIDVVYTGHSLGAGLTQYMTAKTYKGGARGVAFDGPGVANLVPELKGMTDEELAAIPCVDYVMQRDFIGSTGRDVGQVVDVRNPARVGLIEGSLLGLTKTHNSRFFFDVWGSDGELRDSLRGTLPPPPSDIPLSKQLGGVGGDIVPDVAAQQRQEEARKNWAEQTMKTCYPASGDVGSPRSQSVPKREMPFLDSLPPRASLGLPDTPQPFMRVMEIGGGFKPIKKEDYSNVLIANIGVKAFVESAQALGYALPSGLVKLEKRTLDNMVEGRTSWSDDWYGQLKRANFPGGVVSREVAEDIYREHQYAQGVLKRPEEPKVENDPIRQPGATCEQTRQQNRNFGPQIG